MAIMEKSNNPLRSGNQPHIPDPPLPPKLQSVFSAFMIFTFGGLFNFYKKFSNKSYIWRATTYVAASLLSLAIFIAASVFFISLLEFSDKLQVFTALVSICITVAWGIYLIGNTISNDTPKHPTIYLWITDQDLPRDENGRIKFDS